MSEDALVRRTRIRIRETGGVPEGDSVWRAARRMSGALVGRAITASDLRVPRHATADLSGQTVTACVSRGKHMLLRTDAGVTMHTHFRMDGSWTVLGLGRRLPRALGGDVRVALTLDDGRTAVALRMPVVDLLRTADEATVVGHLGPDLLGADWDEAEAVRRLGSDPARPVVEALLDQRALAGIGNLWAVETLFLRGVFPWTPAGSVDLGGAVRLARRMMMHALTHPAQVTTGDTRPGRTHWVYGRAGRGCRRCGTPIVLRKATGAAYQRETWWCPSCQPPQRGTAGRPATPAVVPAVVPVVVPVTVPVTVPVVVAGA